MSQPWMVRVNQMWFFAKNPDDPTEEYADPKADVDADNYDAVLAWEQEQIRQGRICVRHFQLEVCLLF